jgi:hypothetical protein
MTPLPMEKDFGPLLAVGAISILEHKFLIKFKG